MIVFDDPLVKSKNSILCTLHSKFSKVIDCPKGDYYMTEEKVKKLFDTMKYQLIFIVYQYNQSGN